MCFNVNSDIHVNIRNLNNVVVAFFSFLKFCLKNFEK